MPDANKHDIFSYAFMANYSSLTNATQAPSSAGEDATDHTVTFVVGFSVLMLFVIMGVAASAFLCIVLKKDPYLWSAEVNIQAQEEQQCSASGHLKCEETDKLNSTQV